MHELSVADQIWNRACEGGGDSPLPGDSALAALLIFHGLTMNGGVLHAVECLSSDQLVQAQKGYRYFGYEIVADLLIEADKTSQDAQSMDDLEADYNEQYWAIIPDDGTLVRGFEIHRDANCQAYAPIAVGN